MILCGPGGYVVGRKDRVEKNNSFLVETLSKLRFYGSTSLSTLLMTGESSVRSKVDPNWVRRIFKLFDLYIVEIYNIILFFPLI
jgi:hypothetical protein